MGTWGIKTFEDDDSRDWLYSLEDASDPFTFLKKSLINQESKGYLDSIEGKHILCAVEIINGILHAPRQGVPDNAVTWINDHKNIDVSELKEKCVEKIDLVLADQSELKELWSKNDDEYQLWLDNVCSLRKSLI